MQGVSRGALAESRHALQGALVSGADWTTLSDELFSVVGLLDANATLRRAFADPSREGSAKRDLASRLLAGKVSDATIGLVGQVVAQRWSHERDLSNALEQLAIEVRLASAEAGGRADEVESQLFRFERTVAATPELRDALSNPALPTDRKAAVVDRLLAGKSADEVRALAVQAVSNPRGRHLTDSIANVLDIAAARREQLTAVATVAVPLTSDQESRLRGALSSHYGKPILLQSVIDPNVVGGIKVQVGDEVVDGTITRRLDEARRHLGA